MESTVETVFLDFSTRKLEELLSRIRECVAKLDNQQIWMRHGDHENAVANLMLHLSGNMRQWIIAGIGGQPDTRVRDEEFAARGGLDKKELMSRLDATVAEAISVLNGLNSQKLLESYEPQNHRVTILEGIYHVVEHFAQHAGQIMFVTKLLAGHDLGFYRHLSHQQSWHQNG